MICFEIKKENEQSEDSNESNGNMETDRNVTKLQLANENKLFKHLKKTLFPIDTQINVK